MVQRKDTRSFSEGRGLKIHEGFDVESERKRELCSLAGKFDSTQRVFIRPEHWSMDPEEVKSPVVESNVPSSIDVG